MKRILMLCFVIGVLISLSSVALADTSEYEASKVVEEYVLDGETSVSYGPYNYKGVDYFVVALDSGGAGDYIGTFFIVDKSNGEIVSDRLIYYGVSKVHMVALDVLEYDYLTVYSDNIGITREEINSWDDSQEFWDEIEIAARSQDEIDAAKEASELCNKLVNDLQAEILVSQELVDIINDIYANGANDENIDQFMDLSIQLNNNYKDSQASVNEAIEKYPVIYDEFTDTSSAYGITKSEWNDYEEADLQQLCNLNDDYKKIIDYGKMYAWIEDDTDWAWESMNDRLPSTSESKSSSSSSSAPGFGIIAGISSIAIVFYVYRRE